MKNKLSDLNNHLFEQLERLNDEALTEEKFDFEIKRAKAMTGLATQIVKSAEVALRGMEMIHTGKIGTEAGKLIGNQVKG